MSFARMLGAALIGGPAVAAGSVANSVAGIGVRAARGAYRLANGSYGSPFAASTLLRNGRHAAPFQFNRRLQNSLVTGALGLGAAYGVFTEALSQSSKYPKYAAETSPSGAIEVHRADMLGATGDLALALARNGR